MSGYRWNHAGFCGHIRAFAWSLNIDFGDGITLLYDAVQREICGVFVRRPVNEDVLSYVKASVGEPNEFLASFDFVDEIWDGKFYPYLIFDYIDTLVVSVFGEVEDALSHSIST